MNIGEFDDQFTRPLFYSLCTANSVVLSVSATCSDGMNLHLQSCDDQDEVLLPLVCIFNVECIDLLCQGCTLKERFSHLHVWKQVIAV